MGVNVFDELNARGMIAQTTNAEKTRELLGGKEPVTFYIGFDPTADSLHVGHFVQLMVMAHMQKAGHRPVALLGGGTGMIGDPTGKSDMRKMMTPETIQYHVDCFKKQMSRFVDFSEGKALMVNNADWLLNLNYIDFLREVGVHFSVNRMLTFECFKQRLERGLSFMEFNYMLMQSYDFFYLNQQYGCTLELGGDDQWSNILGGVELCRRKAGKEVYGMTFALLTTSEGKKMGKTEKGAVWLDPDKTPPYEFFQYWRNIDDADVGKCLRMLTFLSVGEIEEMERAGDINRNKERLAHELTALVHGRRRPIRPSKPPALSSAEEGTATICPRPPCRAGCLHGRRDPGDRAAGAHRPRALQGRGPPPDPAGRRVRRRRKGGRHRRRRARIRF